MSRPNYISEIKDRISVSEYGAVFVAADFADITDKKTASVVLTRLEADGLLKRVLRGVYYKPEYSGFLKEYIAPAPDNVARALARNFGWTIVPCGDTALNLLALSTQVPAVWLYVSDGTYKEYSYGNTVIRFKRTTNKDISKFSYKTALTVQALKALGKKNVDETVIAKLRGSLSAEEKVTMLREAKIATSWICEYIKQICKG